MSPLSEIWTGCWVLVQACDPRQKMEVSLLLWLNALLGAGLDLLQILFPIPRLRNDLTRCPNHLPLLPLVISSEMVQAIGFAGLEWTDQD